MNGRNGSRATRAARAPAEAAAVPCKQRGAHRLMVDAEGGGDGPDLPVLAEIETPDLGALRGCDHPLSSGRRGATAPVDQPPAHPTTDHTTRADRAPAPGTRQGRGVWRTGGRWGKTDPSRPAERGRPADGLGDRGALPDCADGGPWRAAPSAGGPRSGRAPCSRRGRGRTPGRSQTGGCTSGRSSGEGAGPRWRRSRDDRRLDGEPKPWHNRRDWLGLSELEAVTRVRRHPGPHLRLPTGTLPERPGRHHEGAMDAVAGMDAHDRAHTYLQNRPVGGFAQAPTAHHLLVDQEPRRTQRPSRRDDMRPDLCTFT